jgi:C-3',4' desaturase CrtD
VSPKIIVIGAGIGGLTMAALLAQAGHDITVLEASAYPGGCAGTFYHQGYRFDAGATVAGGFHANGPHALLGERLNITWPIRPSEPAWVVHLPGRRVEFRRDNFDVIAQFPYSQSFWSEQAVTADLLWTLAAEGLPWPPGNRDELLQLLRVALSRVPDIARLLPYVAATTRQWMKRHGLADDAEFVRLIDAQLLISAQTTSGDANALYSAAALDLARQGTYQVQGGMGTIAQTLADKLTALGGRVLYRKQVTDIEMSGGRVRGVYVRTGKRASQRAFLPADFVIANLTPISLDRLLGEDSTPTLRRHATRQQGGWGAFVLNLGVEAAKLPANIADHHQMITDLDGPLGEGRSVFLSLSPEWDTSRAPVGHRAVTITTHTDARQWWDLLKNTPDSYEEKKQEYSERILSAIDARLPGFKRSVGLRLAGTPVTYSYYTGRQWGLVGGFPQTSVLRTTGPRTGIPNLRIVGDSIFPGQSTAAVTLGAMRVTNDVLHSTARPVPKSPTVCRSTLCPPTTCSASGV